MKFYLLLFANILFTSHVAVRAQEFTKTTLNLPLGETVIQVNVYEKEGARITFFAPHYNEQIAIKSTKEAISQNGGRLVEIESLDKTGNPTRNLAFNFKGKSFSIDPNRVFTSNGRRCSGLSSQIESLVRNFSEELLTVIFPESGKHSRSGKKIVVAVHNNANVGEKSLEQKTNDLTAPAFIKKTLVGREEISGAFEEQAAGVFLANDESDPDNFIFLSSPRFLGFFAENNFNVVIQKSAYQLQSSVCSIDDGSLSVFAGQRDIEYICLEADAVTGSQRQKQMLAAVYRLLTRNVEKSLSSNSLSVSEN
jgi:hypothetical protein